jgi:hypothetical protein
MNQEQTELNLRIKLDNYFKSCEMEILRTLNDLERETGLIAYRVEIFRNKSVIGAVRVATRRAEIILNNKSEVC